MHISKILAVKYPDRRWSLNGENYEGLTMLDGLPKPSENELDSLWEEVQAEELKTKTNAKIYAKMDELDRKSIRALRDRDIIYIENYRAEVEKLREQILK